MMRRQPPRTCPIYNDNVAAVIAGMTQKTRDRLLAEYDSHELDWQQRVHATNLIAQKCYDRHDINSVTEIGVRIERSLVVHVHFSVDDTLADENYGLQERNSRLRKPRTCAVVPGTLL